MELVKRPLKMNVFFFPTNEKMIDEDFISKNRTNYETLKKNLIFREIQAIFATALQLSEQTPSFHTLTEV